jgi:hypothetical protein
MRSSATYGSGRHDAERRQVDTAASMFRAEGNACVSGPTLVFADNVLMDNLCAHQVAAIRTRFETSGAALLSWPPHSTDLLPLEPCWAQRKTQLQCAQVDTRDTLSDPIPQLLAAVTPADVHGLGLHCRYA